MICLELGYGCFVKSVFTVSPKTATRTTGLAYLHAQQVAWDGFTCMGPRFEPSFTTLARWLASRPRRRASFRAHPRCAYRGKIIVTAHTPVLTDEVK